jgi:hypothetical protein
MGKRQMARRAPHIRTKRVVDPLPFGPGLNGHRLVVETAKEMANEAFELYAQVNNIYRALRAQGRLTEKQARRAFVDSVAPRMLEDARQTLTSMLGMDDDAVAPNVKEEIYEALLLDNDLRAHRFVAPDQATVPPHLH